MSGTNPGDKPFDASFASSDRYTATPEEEAVQVVVEGHVCDGVVVGRNGPRTHVRFQREGSSYLRWFDSEELLRGAE